MVCLFVVLTPSTNIEIEQVVCVAFIKSFLYEIQIVHVVNNGFLS